MRHNYGHHQATTTMPFAGLGFDLNPVRQAAGLIAWKQWKGTEVQPFLWCAPESGRPAGYTLMLHLSREIRGQ
ncbi:hypothetical protein [Desulfohalobium retbaense]|uniref:Uncharacterized protein n=1 Tax=Desulfohalobium retbaense (strain ATCC 49708 / DSM 5692 / JCM 16813 / HR100) TaxID=485915 RepID=C8WZQ2_DESRD|nr:hypothetical protein [Desulfohalobium retbaense]ACV67527.1 conserved hypothetical protein [Desulfohalobium retbaense DSM 5692]